MKYSIIFAIVAMIGIGLTHSVHAFDATQSAQDARDSASYMKSIGSLMYACSDLAQQAKMDMVEKCAGLVTDFKVLMQQYFTTHKADMEAIMKEAIGGSSDGIPQYNYDRPSEYMN